MTDQDVLEVEGEVEAEAAAEVGAADRNEPVLRHKVVVITGGARALGGAAARVLGLAGARVVLADLDRPRAEEHVAALAAIDVECVAFSVDVGDEEQVRQFIRNVHERFGRLDAIVNNAAIDIAAPIGELQIGGWERVMRTNLTGPFLMIKCALEVMTRGGRIVNVAPAASTRDWPHACASHATKWGLLGLSHALHAELRPRGIKVCAVVAVDMRTPDGLERFPGIGSILSQDPMNAARAILCVLSQPDDTVVAEMTVVPVNETAWP